MRLRVTFDNPLGMAVPINHQEYLTGVVYHLLETSDAGFAHFLHDEGYRLNEGQKTFKLFTFSGLRAARRRVEGAWLRLAPGPVEWLIASPVEAFLTHCATGLLAEGMVRVHQSVFPIVSVETRPEPDFSGGAADFTCLTPIVAGVRRAEGGTEYLTPEQGPAFSEAVRKNLARKYAALHGTPPEDDRLALEFDAGYLAKNRGTKLITYKGIQIKGAFAPFQATGSPALLRTGYECGYGEKNAGGFGMVEVDERGGCR